ncbi:MAG: acetate--CoA ligase family protein [Nitrospirae bacterium]|nr:acetate--CoA ligase family protein [Nitrospirota bacterium]
MAKNTFIALKVREFLERHEGSVLLEHELKGLLKDIGLPVPKGIFIGKNGHIPKLSLSYPLVAKVTSSSIISKTEVKGIRLDIKDKEGLNQAVRELLEIKDAEGVLVEEMAKEGLEVIVGGTLDEQFGPVVMFGLGGVFVETFRDISFALSPLNRQDAYELIRQTKGCKLLEGRRGISYDIDALIKIIIAVGKIISSGFIEEIDLNPIRIYKEGAIILDAKTKAKRNRY